MEVYPMEKLNRQLLTNGFKFNDDLEIGGTTRNT